MESETDACQRYRKCRGKERDGGRKRGKEKAVIQASRLNNMLDFDFGYEKYS